jgi:hypothetical protein
MEDQVMSGKVCVSNAVKGLNVAVYAGCEDEFPGRYKAFVLDRHRVLLKPAESEFEGAALGSIRESQKGGKYRVMAFSNGSVSNISKLSRFSRAVCTALRLADGSIELTLPSSLPPARAYTPFGKASGKEKAQPKPVPVKQPDPMFATASPVLPDALTGHISSADVRNAVRIINAFLGLNPSAEVVQLPDPKRIRVEVKEVFE